MNICVTKTHKAAPLVLHIYTCQRGVEVFKLYDLVGAVAARQARAVAVKVLRDGLLHVPGAAAVVSVVVEHHALEENALSGEEIQPVVCLFRRAHIFFSISTDLIRLLLGVDEIFLHIKQRLVVVHVLGQRRILRVLLQEGVSCCDRFLHVVQLQKNRAECDG